MCSQLLLELLERDVVEARARKCSQLLLERDDASSEHVLVNCSCSSTFSERSAVICCARACIALVSATPSVAGCTGILEPQPIGIQWCAAQRQTTVVPC